MAENLDDGEFWLPPQFLSDDDGDDTINTKAKPSSFSLFNNGEDPLLFPYGFACSDLSSPIDSLAASSETESDDDEQLFAELTRCLSRSSLHVDSKASENHNSNNNLVCINFFVNGINLFFFFFFSNGFSFWGLIFFFSF